MWPELALLSLLLAAPSPEWPVLLTGTVEDAEAERLIAPNTDAWRLTIEWMAPEGEFVPAGAEVVRLDPSELSNRLSQKEAEQRQTLEARRKARDEAALAVLDAEIALAEAQARRERAAVDAAIPEAFIPPFDFERHQTELEKADQQVRLAEQRLTIARERLIAAEEDARLSARRLEEELADLRAQIQSLVLRTREGGFVQYGSTRFRGMVSKLFPGDTVSSGEVVAIVSKNLRPVVRAQVHESDLLRVAVGQAVRVIPDSRPDLVLPGRIVSLSGQGQTRSLWGRAAWFEALVELEPPAAETLKPGISVRVETRPEELELGQR